MTQPDQQRISAPVPVAAVAAGSALAAPRKKPRTPAPASQIDPPARPARASTDHLSGVQKAAIIVRVLLAEGIDIKIEALPSELQAELTKALGTMRLIDRSTMRAVIEEFVDMLEQVGVSFPEGIEGAIALLGGRLDDRAARQLRAMMNGGGDHDPWAVLEAAEEADLLDILSVESEAIGAVLLSKLSTDKAAGLLMKLPQERAQALAIAVSQTEAIAPPAVARIGATLARQVSEKPERAFTKPPAKRFGEILNSSSADLRDSLLQGLDAADQTFASGVRKALFTFADIAKRVPALAVPDIVRDISDEDFKTIIAGRDPSDAETIEFLLGNMSKRLAETLREDAEALPQPKPADREAAARRVTSIIRTMADAGRITLLPEEETD